MVEEEMMDIEWKERIDRTLAGLDKKIDLLSQRDEATSKQLATAVEKLTNAVVGNGNDGLLVRVDRVERAKNVLVWFAGIVSPAIIGLIVSQIFYR